MAGRGEMTRPVFLKKSTGDRPAGRLGSLSAQPGFTLLEALLAIIITAMVVSMIYAPYTGIFKAINITEPEAEIYQKARIAMMRITEDLASAYDSPAARLDFESAGLPLFWGVDHEVGGRSADSLSFVSKAHLVFGSREQEAGHAMIRYEVLQNAQGEDLELLRYDLPEARAAFRASEDEGLLLADGLAGVEFVYYDADGNPRDNWDSAMEESAAKMPGLVDVALEFVDPGNPQKKIKFMTSVILPVASNENLTAQ